MERALVAKLINMNNAHPVFAPILNSIFPLVAPRRRTLKEKLITEFNLLTAERRTQGEYPDVPIITDMARIKTILRERYNYTVNY